MGFQTDFNFGSYGRLNYKDKDLKYYVSYRPNIASNYMNNIFYKPGSANQSFSISSIATADRVVDGVTTFDACDCVGEGVDIGYSGMFNAVGTYKQAFLKAGYNPHLIRSRYTTTSLIYKTSYSDIAAWKNKDGENHYTDFEIARTDSKLIINRKYSTQTKWESHTIIPASSFDQGLIPYVFMFYVQAAGGGGGPSFGSFGGGGGGGGGAVIFMYNFNKGNLHIRLGAPGAGGYYQDSPRGGSGSYSLISDSSLRFSIKVKAGQGAEPEKDGSNTIIVGGAGGKVIFSSNSSYDMTISEFNETFKDTCFIMCYADGGLGGNATTTTIAGTKSEGASMTYKDGVTQKTFSHSGGEGTGGGGSSVTSAGKEVPDGINQPGASAAEYDRGNGGSGATPKGAFTSSKAGGDGGTSEFQIWY